MRFLCTFPRDGCCPARFLYRKSTFTLTTANVSFPSLDDDFLAEKPITYYDDEKEETTSKKETSDIDGHDDEDNDFVTAKFFESLRTNLIGPYYLTRYALRHMIRSKYGRCVYVSSTAATNVGSECGAPGYNTSKSGLLGLMHSVMRDGARCGNNITSNAVLPGWVRTEMAERSAREEASERDVSVKRIWDERAALYPPKRVVEPDEVAHAILWLSSEESSGVSGESIRVALGCPY